ncbi:hypothetical protein [Ectothiorhodospira lacustris]|uniref:hypothetical protein n=1 Tax=Ectothiorhodospira lacustris TaxID=2899127 RepID=UPI001EE974F2|nr:hypothetical protein [Ectothiorhodospira lacustris]MCG5502103.1 hypothetical protein [Ectothiorhodospira lacustris]
MLYLDKLLAQLAYPLGLLFLLALLALLLWLIRWRRTGAGVLCLGLAWVWLWSMPVASDALRASLESRFEYVPAHALPEADAVVVLGVASTWVRPSGLIPTWARRRTGCGMVPGCIMRIGRRG